MVERQDIDALLISALYGELTPAEETRLAAHLDSHPTDRTALADLTQARNVVRESRILQVQLEPPQSISALLLQEAARRAPKKQSEEGWFARFARSFMAHPAMAAAAMLVLVVGVATLATRKGAEFAETSPVATTTEQGLVEGKDSSLSAPQAPSAMAGSAAAAEPATPDRVDQYRVDLDGKFGMADDKAQAAKADEVDTLRDELAVNRERIAAEQQKNEAQLKFKQELAKESSQDRGLELRKPEPAPKDLEEAPTTPKVAPITKAPVRSETESDSSRRDAPVIGGAGAGAKGTTAPGMMPSGANTIALDPTTTTSTTTTGTTTRTTSTPTRPSTGSAQKSPPPPPAQNTAPVKPTSKAATPRDDRAGTDKTARAAGPAEEKPTADPALVWAREQHASLIAQVRAGNCRSAASVAVNLSNRAPGYYAQNVASDRSVKECLAYINNEVTKDAELRAQRERAKRAEPSKRAIDATPRATTKPADAKTDSTK